MYQGTSLFSSCVSDLQTSLYCDRNQTGIMLFLRTAIPVIIKNWATIGLPVKRHLNGVSLVSRWNPKTVCWLGYSKTYVKRPLSKKKKIVFQDQLSLNAGQKYCRMLQGEHSAIFSTFIKLPLVINIFVLSIFEWPFYTGFTLINVTYCGRVSVHCKMKRLNVIFIQMLCQSNKPLQCHALQISCFFSRHLGQLPSALLSA